MKTKKIIIISIFLFSFFLNGNVFAQNKSNQEVDSQSKTLGIQKLVEDKTPPFIKRIIEKTIKTTETFRKGTWQFLEDKRIKAKEDLGRKEVVVMKDITEENNFEDSFDDVIKETKHGIFVKPMKYAELFFLTTTAAFFKNNVIFYIISIILIFFIFRTLTKQ